MASGSGFYFWLSPSCFGALACCLVSFDKFMAGGVDVGHV